MGMPQSWAQTDDVEVFLAGFEAIENAVEEKGVVVELSLEEAEVAAVEFDPEAFALQDAPASGPADSPTSDSAPSGGWRPRPGRSRPSRSRSICSGRFPARTRRRR